MAGCDGSTAVGSAAGMMRTGISWSPAGTMMVRPDGETYGGGAAAASASRKAGADGPCRSTSPAPAASAAMMALACVVSAVRFAGGRVGMNSARMTPAKVGCRPLASTHAQSATPTTT